MLILTRRVGETFFIGGKDEKTGKEMLFDAEGNPVRIDFSVLGVKGNQVRTGTSAPKSIPVHREEIYEKIQKGVPKPSSRANSRNEYDERPPVR